eukprot:SAG31_NODE_8606_length_1421_cov_1.102118_2_plen_250_part_00
MLAEKMQSKGGSETNRFVWLSFAMAIIGCYLFGEASIQLHAVGLLAVRMNCIQFIIAPNCADCGGLVGCQIMINLIIGTTERVFVRYIMKVPIARADGTTSQLRINNAGMMFYQNSLGMIPAVVLILVHREHERFGDVFGNLTNDGMAYVFISVCTSMCSILFVLSYESYMLSLQSVALQCVAGVAISYAGFRLQRRVSATTFMVTSNANKMLVLGFGAFVLGDQYTFVSVFGCFLAVCKMSTESPLIL